MQETCKIDCAKQEKPKQTKRRRINGHNRQARVTDRLTKGRGVCDWSTALFAQAVEGKSVVFGLRVGLQGGGQQAHNILGLVSRARN